MRSVCLALAHLAMIALLLGCSSPDDKPRGAGGAAGASSAGAGGAAAGAGGSAAGMASGGSAVMPYGGFAPVMPVGSDLGAITVEKIALWKGDAKGAYTIIHDDACDWNMDSLFDVAEPELSKRNLRSAFGVIVQRCQERSSWSKLETMRQHGHEIINHSWDHKNIVADAPPLEEQIDKATQTLDAHLVGQKTSFFIFPFDAFNDAAIQRLSKLGYLGARAGKKGVNAADFPDGMRVMFDVYAGENSIYDGQGDILKIYVDLAIAQGGWSVRELHGIANVGGFDPVPLADYQAHLDYVKSKVDSGELWVDTPSAVVRYRFARQYCGLPAVDTYRVNFAQPSADCGRFATPLTLLLTTAQDAPRALAVQNGKMLETKKLGPNRFAVDIDPWQGPAAIGGGT